MLRCAQHYTSESLFHSMTRGEPTYNLASANIAAIDVAEAEDAVDDGLDVLAVGEDHILLACGWIVGGAGIAVVLAALAGAKRQVVDAICVEGAGIVGETDEFLLAQVGVDLALHVPDQLRQVADDAGDVQLFLQGLQYLLLALRAPDIAHEISMARTHIFQRLLAVQMLRPRREIEPLEGVGVVGIRAAARVVGVAIVENGVGDIDIDAAERVDDGGEAA